MKVHKKVLEESLQLSLCGRIGEVPNVESAPCKVSVKKLGQRRAGSNEPSAALAESACSAGLSEGAVALTAFSGADMMVDL
jgi:hypothetical protein